jgi:hypothetical protein
VLSGEKITFEFSNKLGDKLYFFEIFLNPIFLDGVITGVSALSVDITDRKNAELKLEEYTEELKHLPMKLKKSSLELLPTISELLFKVS